MQTIVSMTDPMDDDSLSPTQFTKEPPMPDVARTTCYFNLIRRLSAALGMESCSDADNVLKRALQELEADNR